MLVYVDVLIGVTIIMLGFSLVITVLNQAAANLFALRGRNLKWGLSVLIQELHNEKFPAPSQGLPFGLELNGNVKRMVDKVLAYRLISDSKLPLGPWKLAKAVRFDEFLKVVDLLGAPKTEAANKAAGQGQKTVPMNTEEHIAIEGLQWLRQNNRITETWFNSVMDRVTQRFTLHMRVYTILLAVAIVAATGMDTIHIISVLRTDATIRSGLVAAAESIRNSGALDKNEDKDKLKALSQSVVTQLPADQSLWRLIHEDHPHPAGLFVSILLLSLGAVLGYDGPESLALDGLFFVTATAGSLLALHLLEHARRRVFFQDLVIREQSEAIAREREKSDRLLLNVMPASISARLREGESEVADGTLRHRDVCRHRRVRAIGRGARWPRTSCGCSTRSSHHSTTSSRHGASRRSRPSGTATWRPAASRNRSMDTRRALSSSGWP